MGVKKTDFSKAVKESFQDRDLPRVNYADDTETVVFTLRLHKKRREALQRIFQEKGMDLSNGIRMVLYDWLKNQK